MMKNRKPLLPITTPLGPSYCALLYTFAFSLTRDCNPHPLLAELLPITTVNLPNQVLQQAIKTVYDTI